MDLTKLSATQLLGQLKSGDLSAVDCTEFFLKRIEAHHSLNAFVDVGENGSGSLAKSAALARSRATAVDAGEIKGPLAGLPSPSKTASAPPALKPPHPHACSNASSPVTTPPVWLS